MRLSLKQLPDGGGGSIPSRPTRKNAFGQKQERREKMAKRRAQAGDKQIALDFGTVSEKQKLMSMQRSLISAKMHMVLIFQPIDYIIWLEANVTVRSIAYWPRPGICLMRKNI